MELLRQVQTLVYKDALLELRSKHAINGIILYVVSTVFLCYQAFNTVDSVVWNTLFWIILLFAAINGVSRSFSAESSNRNLYYYTLASPKAIILAKTVYNILLMTLLCFIAFSVYTLTFKIPVEDILFYILAIWLGSISFATILTMVSAISSRAHGNSTLISILGFPLILPLLMVLIKFSMQSLQGIERLQSLNEVLLLVFINVATIAISLLLFPYLWKD